MAGNITELTADNFEETVLKADKPVVVDFWAEWCAPCHAITPSVASLSEQYAGKVTFGKINVDDHGQIAGRYGIASIPTLLLFHNGEVVDRSIGVVPQAYIEAMFTKLL